MIAYDARIKNKELWRAYVGSRGESNDLRQIFPVLVTALEPYIWKNTDREFRIFPSNKRLLKLQSIVHGAPE
jgi:hypothetical protein